MAVGFTALFLVCRPSVWEQVRSRQGLYILIWLLPGDIWGFDLRTTFCSWPSRWKSSVCQADLDKGGRWQACQKAGKRQGRLPSPVTSEQWVGRTQDQAAAYLLSLSQVEKLRHMHMEFWAQKVGTNGNLCSWDRGRAACVYNVLFTIPLCRFHIFNGISGGSLTNVFRSLSKWMVGFGVSHQNSTFWNLQIISRNWANQPPKIKSLKNTKYSRLSRVFMSGGPVMLGVGYERMNLDSLCRHRCGGVKDQCCKGSLFDLQRPGDPALGVGR